MQAQMPLSANKEKRGKSIVKVFKQQANSTS